MTKCNILNSFLNSHTNPFAIFQHTLEPSAASSSAKVSGLAIHIKNLNEQRAYFSVNIGELTLILFVLCRQDMTKEGWCQVDMTKLEFQLP